ncbi:hypothetical protein EYF80_022587 [Liparis tanakae]|uniref:Uncharacterized protein n=1 Tax=Liparis tanakae TaxID=230148 RepID=A0A4Z2HNI6_9TELE|nr:hypothetical protein EYF80_022587 [Liparis tanakae]
MGRTIIPLGKFMFSTGHVEKDVRAVVTVHVLQWPQPRGRAHSLSREAGMRRMKHEKEEGREEEEGRGRKEGIQGERTKLTFQFNSSRVRLQEN